MPRRPRVNTGGFPYHVLNRAVGRGLLFNKPADYESFEKALAQTHDRLPVRIASYCLMPNHWHLVLWPQGDGDLSEFMRLLTVTHTQRWHAHHHSAGTGPLYQGRFKSYPIQQDSHFLSVCRYVERNALRARKVERAQNWQWCGFSRRMLAEPPSWLLPTGDWPVPFPSDWAARVNRPQSQKELIALQNSLKRGRPYGDDRWSLQTARALRLESSLRPRGRPRHEEER